MPQKYMSGPGGGDHSRIARLVLGTAQFGLNYGVTNRTRLASSEKQEFLSRAFCFGVTTFYTARACGESEIALGCLIYRLEAEQTYGRLCIITKLDPLAQLSSGASKADVSESVNQSILVSLEALGMEQLQVVQLHRAAHVRSQGGAVLERLLWLKREGVIANLGVSAQSPKELFEVIRELELTHFQLPFNLLDWVWEPILEELEIERRRRSLTIYARNVYLQVLLVTEEPRLWARAHVEDSEAVTGWLDRTSAEYGRTGVGDLCLAFVASQDWVDGIVIGIDNERQFAENVALMQRPPLRADEIARIAAERPRLAAATLDPSSWGHR